MGRLCRSRPFNPVLVAVALVNNPKDKRCVLVPKGMHFNECHILNHLNELVRHTQPLQHWTASWTDSSQRGEPSEPRLEIGLSEYDIYGNRLKSIDEYVKRKVVVNYRGRTGDNRLRSEIDNTNTFKGCVIPSDAQEKLYCP